MSILADMLDDLTALIESEPVERDGLKIWYEAAAHFREKYPLRAEVLPHVVEHYLADADIRVRDPGYREIQLAEVDHALDALRG